MHVHQSMLQKLIEGKFTAGDKVLIFEDVVSTGSSVLDTVDALATEGLVSATHSIEVMGSV